MTKKKKDQTAENVNITPVMENQTNEPVMVQTAVKLKKDGTPAKPRGRKPGQKNAPKVPVITALIVTCQVDGDFVVAEFDNGFIARWGGTSGEPSSNVGFLSASRAKLAGEFLSSLPVYSGDVLEFVTAMKLIGATSEQLRKIGRFCFTWELPVIVAEEVTA